jgi:hypothetical protein
VEAVLQHLHFHDVKAQSPRGNRVPGLMGGDGKQEAAPPYSPAVRARSLTRQAYGDFFLKRHIVLMH